MRGSIVISEPLWLGGLCFAGDWRRLVEQMQIGALDHSVLDDDADRDTLRSATLATAPRPLGPDGSYLVDHCQAVDVFALTEVQAYGVAEIQVADGLLVLDSPDHVAMESQLDLVDGDAVEVGSVCGGLDFLRRVVGPGLGLGRFPRPGFVGRHVGSRVAQGFVFTPGFVVVGLDAGRYGGRQRDGCDEVGCSHDAPPNAMPKHLLGLTCHEPRIFNCLNLC